MSKKYLAVMTGTVLLLLLAGCSGKSDQRVGFGFVR